MTQLDDMFLTFFCKRDKHSDCPGSWPTNETCGPDEDCSFDMKMVPCDCTCHSSKNLPNTSTSIPGLTSDQSTS